MSQLTTFMSFSFDEKKLVIASLLLLPATNLLLKLFGFKKTISAFEKFVGRSKQMDSPILSSSRAADLVYLAHRKTPFGGACLSRSIVLWSLLRRLGFQASVEFGSRLKNDELEAHAWVEIEEKAIIPDTENISSYHKLNKSAVS